MRKTHIQSSSVFLRKIFSHQPSSQARNFSGSEACPGIADRPTQWRPLPPMVIIPPPLNLSNISAWVRALITAKFSALSPRIVGRPASLQSGSQSFLLVVPRSLRSGKPRLPVSLIPANDSLSPASNGFVRLGNKISRPRKIWFLWRTNLIFRKSWEAGRQQQFTGEGTRCQWKSVGHLAVRRRSGQLSEFLLIFGLRRNTLRLLPANTHCSSKHVPAPPLPICLGGKWGFGMFRIVWKLFACSFHHTHMYLVAMPQMGQKWECFQWNGGHEETSGLTWVKKT